MVTNPLMSELICSLKKSSEPYVKGFHTKKTYPFLNVIIRRHFLCKIEKKSGLE